jgi:hypothetical protein
MTAFPSSRHSVLLDALVVIFVVASITFAVGKRIIALASRLAMRKLGANEVVGACTILDAAGSFLVVRGVAFAVVKCIIALASRLAMRILGTE